MGRNDEIEEVMSSVRRLVSGGKDVETARDEPVAAAAPLPILLLGPACRVTEVEDPFQMIRSLAQEEQDARDARHLLDAHMRNGVAESLPRDATGGAQGAGVAARNADGIGDLADRLGGEEALRELVAETVRRELSGELGQRITGSVRKLVRHELLRMLTAEPGD